MIPSNSERFLYPFLFGRPVCFSVFLLPSHTPFVFPSGAFPRGSRHAGLGARGSGGTGIWGPTCLGSRIWGLADLGAQGLGA